MPQRGFFLLEETIVFIDGAYLSVITKHFGESGKHLELDINQFAISLAREQQLWCREVYFYVSPPFQNEPPTSDQQERRRKYDRFVTKLGRIPGLTVREGRCQKTEDGYHQKGVDTWITMDLMAACYGKSIKTIVILACDTDFVPILKEVRRNGIKVILYYYSDFVRDSRFSMSNHILTACDNYVLVTKALLLRSKKIPSIQSTGP